MHTSDLFSQPVMTTARTHVLILVSVLIIYGIYSIAVAFRRYWLYDRVPWLYAFGGLYSLAAARGAATAALSSIAPLRRTH
jgi:hypothetical protein